MGEDGASTAKTSNSMNTFNSGQKSPAVQPASPKPPAQVVVKSQAPMSPKPPAHVVVKSQAPMSPKPPAQVVVKSQAPMSPKSPKQNASSSTPVRSPRTPSFVPPGVITSVPPHTPKDMMGAQTSMDTGITYPVNVWGPITKFGYLDDIEPRWSQKKHFEGKLDKLMKKRLQARRFCFVRHPAYKELIEPMENTSQWLDPKRKEFWRTDVERVLHREADQRKARYKELLGIWGNESGWRESEKERDREDRWHAFLDYDKNVREKPGFRNNTTGCPSYDIFTLKASDGYEGNKMLYKEELARYKAAARSLYIQERTSGARPYNIISWVKEPPCRVLPSFPEDIGPPPPSDADPNKIPLNASKGPLSFAHMYGPFGTIPWGTP